MSSTRMLVLGTMAALAGCDVLELVPDDPYEPNDAIETAYDLTAGAVPEAVSGAVVTHVDTTDFFAFTNNDSANGTAVVSGSCVPDLPFTISLLGDDGSSLWSAAQQTTIAMTQPVTVGGTYYLKIELVSTSEDDAATYAFTLSFVP